MDELTALELLDVGAGGDLENARLQQLVVGSVFGVLLHLGQLEVELLHDGRRFVNALQVRNPRTRTTLVVSVDVAPVVE